MKKIARGNRIGHRSYHTYQAGRYAPTLVWFGMRLMRLASLGCGIFLGCGGNTDYSTVSFAGGSGSTLASGGSSTHWPVATGGTVGTGGRGYSTYTAVGCPDSGAAPIVVQECNLFSTVSGCPDGQACFPAIRSSADLCQPEMYYYVCSYAGSGTQWDTCSSANDCAQGFICVVTNAGTKCQRTCSMDDSSAVCPPGLFCDPIDVAGVGTCS